MKKLLVIVLAGLFAINLIQADMCAKFPNHPDKCIRASKTKSKKILLGYRAPWCTPDDWVNCKCDDYANNPRPDYRTPSGVNVY